MNEDLPEEIREVFTVIQDELVWLHGRWIIYKQLYHHNEERITVLHKTGSTFFYIIKQVLEDELVLSISKLTDPAKLGDNKNLSLECLINQLKNEDELKSNLMEILEELKACTQKIRKRRNKRISHYDLLTNLYKEQLQATKPTLSEIEEALKIIRKFLNTIELHFANSEMSYENFRMISDGDTLAFYLKSGLRYQDLVKDKILSLQDLKESKYKNA